MLKNISFVNVKVHRNFVSASQNSKVVVVCTPLLLEIIVYMKKTAKTDNLNYQFIAVSFIYILALYLASPLNIGRYIESCGIYVTNIRTIIITA